MTISFPKLTVIVAVLNGAKTLERCLKSIISQEYPSTELIVIDGGSSDGSVAILENWHDNITYWESISDRGVYHAWNKGLRHATGDWICFLGADDFFLEASVLSSFIPHLVKAENEGIRIVYGRAMKLYQDGNVAKLLGKSWKRIRWQMKHGMPLDLPHPGMMHYHRLFKEHGLFDETFRFAGDYEFLLRELKDKKRKALYVNEIIAVALQAGGLSETNHLLVHREVEKARRKNGLRTLSWLWLVVHVRMILRKFWRRTILN